MNMKMDSKSLALSAAKKPVFRVERQVDGQPFNVRDGQLWNKLVARGFTRIDGRESLGLIGLREALHTVNLRQYPERSQRVERLTNIIRYLNSHPAPDAGCALPVKIAGIVALSIPYGFKIQTLLDDSKGDLQANREHYVQATQEATGYGSDFGDFTPDIKIGVSKQPMSEALLTEFAEGITSQTVLLEGVRVLPTVDDLQRVRRSLQ